MQLITISGLDGSGKSTQIQMLKDYLVSQNKRVFYFHAIKFGIANRVKNVLKNKCIIFSRPWNYDTFKEEEKSVTMANNFQIWLRKIFLKIDLVRFKSLIAKLEKEGYDYLISDRYFYDSVVNIEFLNRCHSERSEESRTNIVNDNRQGSFTNAQDDIIKPDVAIYLQTSPDVIMSRERKPDQGIGYLQKKKEIYDKYADIWNLKIMDGNRNKEEIFEEVKSYVK